MKAEVLTSIRLPAEVLARADRLIPRLQRRAEMAAMGDVTRAHVLRLALARGLDALERESARRKP